MESSARLYRDDAATLPDTAIHKVLYDAIEFAQAWEQATAALDQPPSPHEIDFTQYMVVYVSAGRSDPGDQIQVDSVGIRWDPDPRSPQDYVEVRYFKVCIIREPNPFPGVSYPLELVRVNRWEGPVRWEWCGEGG